MKRFKTLALASVVALAAGAAWATPIQITYNGGTSDGTVRITSVPAGAPAVKAPPLTVGAWGFNMTDSLGPLGDFVAWCLDLGSYLANTAAGAQDYFITASPFSNSFGLDADEIARVQSMFDANYDDVDLTVRDQAASFQAALWEVLYDDDFDLTSGDFQAEGKNNGLTFAATYLDNAKDYDGDKRFNLSFLESTGTPQRQNLVTVSPVPVPAAGILLVTALGGLAMARRRRRAA